MNDTIIYLSIEQFLALKEALAFKRMHAIKHGLVLHLVDERIVFLIKTYDYREEWILELQAAQ